MSFDVWKIWAMRFLGNISKITLQNKLGVAPFAFSVRLGSFLCDKVEISIFKYHFMVIVTVCLITNFRTPNWPRHRISRSISDENPTIPWGFETIFFQVRFVIKSEDWSSSGQLVPRFLLSFSFVIVHTFF